MLRVAAAIISNKEGKVLICRRCSGNCSGLWEFPGGKQEQGESLVDCVIRECQEELDIVIKPGEVFGVESYYHDGKRCEFTFLEAKLIKGTLKPSVHSEVRWVDTEELRQQEYCPADMGVVEALCGQ